MKKSVTDGILLYYIDYLINFTAYDYVYDLYEPYYQRDEPPTRKEEEEFAKENAKEITKKAYDNCLEDVKRHLLKLNDKESITYLRISLLQFNDFPSYHEDTFCDSIKEKCIEIDKRLELQHNSIHTLSKMIWDYFMENDYERIRDQINNLINILETDALNKTKLETNISVEKLAALFKILYDLEPKLFKTRISTDIQRFISMNFSTKKAGIEADLGLKKLGNLFTSPDPKALDFWEDNLNQIQTIINNYREKNSK